MNDIWVVIEHLRRQVADISYVMLAAGRVLTDASGGDLVAFLLGHEAEELANGLAADKVIYVDHSVLAEFVPDAYLEILSHQIKANSPRAILFGYTSVGMDVASGLSARLGLPVVSQCQTVSGSDGELHFVSQICGGKIMAEGVLPGPTALLTMVPGGYKPEQGRSAQKPEVSSLTAPAPTGGRMTLTQYIEPEVGDVDITREPVLIAVGRGLQNEDELALVEELADALGGAVCASRPLVDQGWLPASRLVGKSGKTVHPELYMALGISGAPEHVEGMSDSELIIAVNTDPDAPIFDVASYGVVVDMFDLLEALNDQVQQVMAV